MQTYELKGGDGAAYGSLFGPVVAEEIGEITFLDDNHYLLLKIIGQLTIEKEEVQYLVIAPRYKGDTINTIRMGQTTVVISRVLPGITVNLENGLGKDDVHYFAVGQCKPFAV